ncbi:MAG: phosphoribosylglycinamide formyltransferase [Propionibacteriaceae bacterium]
MSPLRVVVLLSGTGTLCQALLDAQQHGQARYQLVAVGSDDPNAPGLVRAQNAGLATFAVPMERPYKRGSAQRHNWDEQLTEAVAAYAPDLVVSAGFMKLFDRPFMQRFGDRIINTHPALLPAFPGAHAVRDALAAGATVTGASIFWVNDGIDTGELIAQSPVPVEPGDTEETLHERIKIVERELLVETVNSLADKDLT